MGEGLRPFPLDKHVATPPGGGAHRVEASGQYDAEMIEPCSQRDKTMPAGQDVLRLGAGSSWAGRRRRGVAASPIVQARIGE